MKNKYIVATIAFVFFIGITAYAQDQLNNFILEHSVVKSREAKRTIDYEGVKGTPYYTPDYIQSYVHFPKGDSVPINLRYDMYFNEMEFKKENWTMWMTKNQIRMVQHGDDRLILAEIPGQKGLGYLFLEVDGKYSLLRKKSVTFKPAQAPKAYQDAIPEEFIQDSDVFYIKRDNMPLQVLTTKKDLEELVSGNQAALDFIKKEKIKVGKEDDLIKLTTFLNTL